MELKRMEMAVQLTASAIQSMQFNRNDTIRDFAESELPKYYAIVGKAMQKQQQQETQARAKVHHEFCKKMEAMKNETN